MAIINLTTNAGITPALKNTTETLSVEIWAAIDKAIDSGIPANTLIGVVKIVEAKLMRDFFDSVGVEK